MNSQNPTLAQKASRVPPAPHQPAASQHTTAAPPSPDPEKALRSVLDIVSRLTELLEREQDLVIKRKVVEHAELLKVKQKLALDYHAGLQVFALHPDLLKKVPESMRREARNAAERLSTATQRNARGLRAAILAVQKLTQTIVSMVKREALPAAGYGNIKPSKSTIGQYSPSCPPVVVRRNA